MNIEKIIDTILSTDFKNLPQKPRWVDGSGLSRYNLFTPQDFVYILNKLNDEYGIERMKRIFATGNEGTLKGYYVADSNFIFAKTGTMSGVVALSGYLITKKNKLLCFSILANNHTTSAIALKKAIEQFLLGVRRKN
jgi:D-alanyl-D-alanine carboxypeptidase/D-alanyl-D-alanine-endopeptidase (penicillin-binding protein 4)